jgi:squalene-hopene/tetraprenyl-beta-curcumene cyclase
MRFTLLTLVLLAALGPFTASQDTKGMADGLVRLVRAHQQDDGGYGDLPTTCRVLDLMARSPRRYNELDGPYFRRAAEQVAADSDPTHDAWRVLALSSAVTPRLVAARNGARDRLLDQASRTLDPIVLLALHTLPPPVAPRLAAIPDGAPPELAILLTADPASVAAPAVNDRDAWTRWARAARLRGERPHPLPELPAEPPRPGAPLAELLDQLEFIIAVHGLVVPATASAESPPPPLPPTRGPGNDMVTALEDALAFLESHHQNGTFGLLAPGWNDAEPGVTALCLSATMHASDMLGRSYPDWVDNGLDWLASLQGPDGSIQTYGVAVYTTSVAMEALIDRGRDSDRPVVEAALAFLVAAQADEGEGYLSADDPHYGGVGYGGDERPDLSNMNIALDAVARAELDPDHPFFDKALTFLQRNQNLAEAGNWRLPRAGGGTLVPGTDGGATYMPGSSPAGEEQVADGVYVARSYGSMTYALTKSYLICGLAPDDARVVAAVDWLADNFTLETNPGFADPGHAGDGLYYYYMAMARTLRLVAGERLVRGDGSSIEWRAELGEHLLAQQRTDGSWVNEDSSRWYEGSPTLCSAFAILSLAAADS